MGGADWSSTWGGVRGGGGGGGGEGVVVVVAVAQGLMAAHLIHRRLAARNVTDARTARFFLFFFIFWDL